MARLYLRVEASLPRHPKVLKLVDLLGLPEREGPYLVVGFLLSWWGYSAEFGSGGNSADVPRTVLKAMAAPLLAASLAAVIPDIAEALREAKLMDRYGKPWDWQDYTGKLLEARQKDVDRKRNVRGHSEDIPRPVVQHSTVVTTLSSPAPVEKSPWGMDQPPQDEDPVRPLIPEAYRSAYDGFRTAARDPVAFAAIVRGAGLGGIHECGSWEQVGQALGDMAGNGNTFNANLFRGCVRKLKDAPKGPVDIAEVARRGAA